MTGRSARGTPGPGRPRRPAASPARRAGRRGAPAASPRHPDRAPRRRPRQQHATSAHRRPCRRGHRRRPVRSTGTAPAPPTGSGRTAPCIGRVRRCGGGPARGGRRPTGSTRRSRDIMPAHRRTRRAPGAPPRRAPPRAARPAARSPRSRAGMAPDRAGVAVDEHRGPPSVNREVLDTDATQGGTTETRRGVTTRREPTQQGIAARAGRRRAGVPRRRPPGRRRSPPAAGPAGSARTRRRISSSAVSPLRENRTRTPRGAGGSPMNRSAPSNTTVTSAPVCAASPPSPLTSRLRCCSSEISPYPVLVTL